MSLQTPNLAALWKQKPEQMSHFPADLESCARDIAGEITTSILAEEYVAFEGLNRPYLGWAPDYGVPSAEGAAQQAMNFYIYEPDNLEAFDSDEDERADQLQRLRELVEIQLEEWFEQQEERRIAND